MSVGISPFAAKQTTAGPRAPLGAFRLGMTNQPQQEPEARVQLALPLLLLSAQILSQPNFSLFPPLAHLSCLQKGVRLLRRPLHWRHLHQHPPLVLLETPPHLLQTRQRLPCAECRYPSSDGCTNQKERLPLGLLWGKL